MSVFTVKNQEKNAAAIKSKTFMVILAVAMAVLLPQLLHLAGSALGISSALGNILLPMHLPVILVGFMAGPIAGAVTGILAPVISFVISGMPTAVMLPVIMAELCAYGFFAGLFNSLRVHTITKVVMVQFAGRICRAAATFAAVYIFESTLSVATIWTSITVGFAGIVIQWLLLPAIIKRIKGVCTYEG